MIKAIVYFILATVGLLIVGCCSTKPKSCALPPTVIDLHTHLFNANYLPIRELLVAHNVARGVAEALELLTRSMTGDSHLAEPDGLITRGSGLDSKRIKTISKAPPGTARQVFLQEIARLMEQGGVTNRL